eukprot:15175151-Ditylum_brightwellii.AAC.1
MPKTAAKEAVTHAALDLITALKDNHPATLYLHMGDKQRRALQKLTKIFQGALEEKQAPMQQPTLPPAIPHPLYMPQMPTAAPPPFVSTSTQHATPPQWSPPNMFGMHSGPLPRVPPMHQHMHQPAAMRQQHTFVPVGQYTAAPR